MTHPVREAYDANAELYASLFLHELDRDTQSTRWLTTFAAIAADSRGEIVDLGCGPGSAIHFLSQRGLTATGIDLSPGQVAQARHAFPDLAFEIGDLTALRFDDASLGGIVSRYSLIHLPPSDIAGVFVEWFRALEPGAPVFIAFFGSRSVEAHGTPFDHKVVTAYELSLPVITDQLEAAGFADVEQEAVAIPEGGRPYDHATILARKPAA